MEGGKPRSGAAEEQIVCNLMTMRGAGEHKGSTHTGNALARHSIRQPREELIKFGCFFLILLKLKFSVSQQELQNSSLKEVNEMLITRSLSLFTPYEFYGNAEQVRKIGKYCILLC